MKDWISLFLTAFAFGAFSAATHNVSTWGVVASGIAAIYGIKLMIDAKIERLKEEQAEAADQSVIGRIIADYKGNHKY